MRRIDDLDEYHAEIEWWFRTHVWWPALYIAIEAENNNLPAPFVFQDETAEHFNHDVLLECRRRLG